MNRLKTTDIGGFPFELDDLRWIDEGLREGFKGLAKIFGDNFICSGFTVTGLGTSSTTWTEGYVVIGGEVCKIDASASPLDTTGQGFTTYIEIESTYDSTGLEYFENNTQHDTYEIRKAVVNTYSSAQSGLVAIASLATAEKLVNDMLPGYIHQYTKRQSWAQGTDITQASGANTFTLDYAEGNAYNVNVDSADTVVTTFTSLLNNGTWLALKFTGNSTSTIQIGEASGYIKTPGGRTYTFSAGDVALFIVFSSKYWLVNGKDNATETLRGVAELATQTEVNTGSDDTRIITPLKLKTANNLMHTNGTRLYTKTMQIGTWDMNTNDTPGFGVSHGLTDHTTIRSVNAIVISDNQSEVRPLNYANLSGEVSGSISYIDSSSIYLLRKSGGIFDATGYQSTGVNRGYITIVYEA